MRTALFGRIALACTPFGRPRLRVPEAATICERHPLLVTVPIGAWMSSLAFDALSATGRIEDERMYAAGAKTLIDIGIASAAARPRSVCSTFCACRAARGHRLQRSSPPYVTRGERGLSMATALALLGSGWLGGSLVYHYGVRVADETHQRTTGYGEDGVTDVRETAEYRTKPPDVLSL